MSRAPFAGRCSTKRSRHERPGRQGKKTWTRSKSPRATRSEALQLERLRWSLNHAYDNVANVQGRASTQAGVHPDDLTSLADLARLPFTEKEDLRTHYPFGSVRRSARKNHAHPRIVGHDGQAHGGGLHRRAIARFLPTWWPAACAPPAFGRGTWCTTPMATGCSPAVLGRTTGSNAWGRRSCPWSGGMTQRQVMLINDFRPTGHHGHAVLRAEHPGGVQGRGA